MRVIRIVAAMTGQHEWLVLCIARATPQVLMGLCAKFELTALRYQAQLDMGHEQLAMNTYDHGEVLSMLALAGV